MKLIEVKIYLVGFRFKDSNATTAWRAVEGDTLSDIINIAEEYASKHRYVISIIKENDTNTLRSSTKTISIDI